jgi:hypothetical protein
VPIDDGRKPDIAFGISYKGKGRFFFFVEVKRPGQSSIYQDEDDYVKLLKQMKTSVDAQIDLRVRNPTSLGLLVEGILIFVINSTIPRFLLIISMES